MKRLGFAIATIVLCTGLAGFAAEEAKKASSAAAAPGSGAPAVPAAPGSGPQTDEQKTIYALGLSISRDLGRFAMSADDLKWLESGLEDGLLKHDKKVDLAIYGPKINDLMSGRMKKAAEAERKTGAEFLSKAAAQPGAVKTESGMVYTELKAGDGPSPAASDRVKVNYEGKLIDGTVFDSSINQGGPAEFFLTAVVKCWTEGVQKMKVGGKSRLICPADLAWGDRGTGSDIGPGATVDFEVELLAITTPPPAAPGEPAAPGAPPAPPKPPTPPPPPHP